MLLFRRKNKTHVTHYAPELDITPQDYMPLKTEEQRLKEMLDLCTQFLSQTNPDKHNKEFLVSQIKAEGESLKKDLELKKATHKLVCTDIINSHKALLAMVDDKINSLTVLQSQYDDEISRCKELYESHNGYRKKEEKHDRKKDAEEHL